MRSSILHLRARQSIVRIEYNEIIKQVRIREGKPDDRKKAG
jgi:hypothetical protein